MKESKDRTKFVLVLAVLLLTLVTGQKTKNQIEREKAIYPYVLFPRVFDEIVTDPLETPIQVRAYFYLNLGSYNAWSNYHPTAVDCFGRSKYKRPKSEHTVRNKNIAILFTLWRMYQKFPSSFGGESKIQVFRTIIREQGFNPDDMSTDMSSPVGIGNKMGFDTALLLNNDGWNSNGDVTVKQKNYQLPFADFTAYTPKNDPWKIKYPFKWQPLLETNKMGFFFRQEHVVPQIGSSIAFSVTPEEVQRSKARYPFKKNFVTSRKISRKDKNRLRGYARQVLKTSETLTERQRVLAEYFDNKVKAFTSEKYNPSGSLSIAAAIRFVGLPFLYDWTYDEDIIFGMAANIAAFDSTVQVWKEKVRIDAIRPTGQTMEFLFGSKKTVKVWGGPGKKAPIEIFAKNWQPYIRAMPHSEFPSGSSCLCEASIQQALKFTNGNDSFPFTVAVPKGSSKFYPGKLPSSDVRLEFKSLREIGRLCGDSRLWAGVHFQPAIPAGRKLCSYIGETSQNTIDDWVSGKSNTKFLKWLPAKFRKSWD